jgi:mono/diheme cytochrome c family protein
MRGFDRLVSGIAFLLLLAATALGGTAAGAQTGLSRGAGFPSGEQLFQEHCATCHGSDGKGNGPMAQVLKTPPADLTQMSVRAGGTFPAARVVEIIRYGGDISGHGTAVMPVWGKVFSSKGGGGKGGGAYSRRAVIELKRYLESIQKKAP